MFNQPERRQERDEALLDEIYEACRSPDALSARFIGRVLGSDDTVLRNIQTTIDLRFQSLEAGNTVKSLSRPILSDQPAIRQIQLINDRYYHQAIDLQNEWAEAKRKQEAMKGKGTVHIPYTLEQIKHAFQVVVDMCLLLIDLKTGENTKPAREAIARAYALASAAAIQIGRYDLVEEFAARWRDHFELHTDADVPLRVRNLLFQKELWIFKRKGELAAGLEIAEAQWAAGAAERPGPRWMDLEPLVCAGLELASLRLKKVKGDGNDAAAEEARGQVARWLDRFERAPERAAELGEYLQHDPELKPIREENELPAFRDKWRALMKKFTVAAILFLGLTIGLAFLTAGAAAPPADQPVAAASPAPETQLIQTAGANPGTYVWDFFDWLFGLGNSRDRA
jgi:hypothetical protein